ncbi:MAG TPA: DEAD/DEAH box helicase family protein [Chthonomonadaceae bacterium]|nr:DEAD/DEAH box helicase family protein [Chthonomonadaceae bacterium]
MPRLSRNDAAQLNLLEARVSTAPCVPAIRKAVAEWKEGGYKGVTPTTRALLSYWFRTDHRLPNRRKFAYHRSQQEAIETLIYLYEVAQIRRQKALLETFVSGGLTPQLLQYDDFPRYCIKMATGSGKTKVMALAIAWHYFNAVRENRPDYARTFLLLAPNVIVYERLCTDFAGGRIFKSDPVIPPEMQLEWDFDVYLRGEGERADSLGALYLTNIQQLHDRAAPTDDEPDIMTQILGSRPPARAAGEDFAARIAARPGHCLVLNDEAHHTHDEKLKWNEVIRDLHARLAANGSPLSHAVGEGGRGGEGHSVLQLDFTATPRYNRGALFTWTVYDYPLKQAILDAIVKRPVKGVSSGIQEQQSAIASVRYRAYLTAGVERWREYRDQLAPLGKKPLLFVMMNDTTEADDVEDYLKKTYPAEFGGDRLLNIHTDRSGEVSKKDVEAARQIARRADAADSPLNGIVSVLMLREGWDVQNVTVVVGLRPYSSKANILPEQTIGRGLRLMFRDLGTTYVERVDIIGNRAFLEFVDALEREEDIQLEKFEIGKDKLVIVTIQPDETKQDKDISIPVLSPVLARKKTLAEEIAALDVSALSCPTLPMKENDAAAQNFRYEGYDLITLEKIVEREYRIPEPQTAQEVIAYYAKRIAQDVKLPSQFAALAPKVRAFLEQRAFGQPVSLDSPAMIKAISSNVASYITIKTFVAALRGLVLEQLTPQLLCAGRKLSETPPFPWSRPTVAARKTVFNLAACDNEFEKRYAQFLQDAPDVEAFAKLPAPFGFVIEYTDNATNLRYYEPDFVAVLRDGTHYLLETKGREDIDVAHKDRAAALWCENATALTGTEWRYLKVPQTEFDKLRPDEFADLLALAG